MPQQRRKEIDFWTALCSSTEYRVAALFRGLPSPSVELQRAFLLVKMISVEDQTDEIIFHQSAESRYNRVRELIKAEKELSDARGMLAAWEIFRQGISQKYPELLVWCPGYSTAPAPHEVGNYEPLDFLLPGNQPLEIMEGETMQEFEARMSTITIHDPELPGVVIIDSVKL